MFGDMRRRNTSAQEADVKVKLAELQLALGSSTAGREAMKMAGGGR
jgi:hypothetical protein